MPDDARGEARRNPSFSSHLLGVNRRWLKAGGGRLGGIRSTLGS